MTFNKGFTYSLNRFGKAIFDERYRGCTPQIHVDGLVVANLDPAPDQPNNSVNYTILVLGKSVKRPGTYQRLGLATVRIRSHSHHWVDKLSLREFTII
jgi:hypothetical protein